MSKWANVIQRLKQVEIESNEYAVSLEAAEGSRLKAQTAKETCTKHIEIHGCYTGKI